MSLLVDDVIELSLIRRQDSMSRRKHLCEFNDDLRAMAVNITLDAFVDRFVQNEDIHDVMEQFTI